MRRIRAVIVRLMFVVSGHVTKTAVWGGNGTDLSARRTDRFGILNSGFQTVNVKNRVPDDLAQYDLDQYFLKKQI